MLIEFRLIFSRSNEKLDLRGITPDDVTIDYVDGLRKQKQYIENIPVNVDVESQKKYIRNINDSSGEGIFGLFVDGEMIGTAGVQELSEDGPVSIGIFIFKEETRGRGFGRILVWAACTAVHRITGTRLFRAGMKRSNIPSFKSFLSSGFSVTDENINGYTVELNYSDLILPPGVENIRTVKR